MTKIDIDHVAFISETSLTIRGSRRRTTVPKEIAEKLKLEDGDKIRWILFYDNSIMVSKVHKNPKIVN